VKQLIYLIALIVQLIIYFFNRTLIAVIMHILFVTFFNLFVPFAGRHHWPTAVEC